jgi:YhcH/YjgK/YiaL family protein
LDENGSKKINLEGDDIIVNFQTYTSRAKNDLKIEGHKKYIDIQYLFSGEECIYLASQKDVLKAEDLDTEKDVFFAEVKSASAIHLRKGDALILMPEDLHGPGYCIDNLSEVQKIVIKVAVD